MAGCMRVCVEVGDERDDPQPTDKHNQRPKNQASIPGTPKHASPEPAKAEGCLAGSLERYRRRTGRRHPDAPPHRCCSKGIPSAYKAPTPPPPPAVGDRIDVTSSDSSQAYEY
ncbi:conserved hypothetical protein [Coccidioides posadasii str. Silveira]|uniref:Uncharacterized protein n=1 Tax=Coccidioides posadasii (strain RMSCC 757 / Silveira) TaxID=443226 RepID=E9DGF8_COCPS|nr:conserved hypothetical protein [Coccidioides posadasii str. Silveira]